MPAINGPSQIPASRPEITIPQRRSTGLLSSEAKLIHDRVDLVELRLFTTSLS